MPTEGIGGSCPRTLGGHVNTISDQQGGPHRRRRLHSDEFKADAVANCMRPGMSMAAVAMAHGINANLLCRWVREAELRPPGGALTKAAAHDVQAPETKPLFDPVIVTSLQTPPARARAAAALWCASAKTSASRLDVVSAEFFVHRHIYGKWACRCCQVLKQQPTVPEIIDAGLPVSGLLAHTLISRFADHLPYYRQEAINARAGVHTPCSTLASWASQAGAALEPLYEAHKRFVLASRVLHADETPVALLDTGAGKTRKTYVWAYARSHHDPTPGVVYEFARGRAAQYPRAFR